MSSNTSMADNLQVANLSDLCVERLFPIGRKGRYFVDAVNGGTVISIASPCLTEHTCRALFEEEVLLCETQLREQQPKAGVCPNQWRSQESIPNWGTKN